MINGFDRIKMMPFSATSRCRAIAGVKQFSEIARILDSAIIRDVLDGRLASSRAHCRVCHSDAIYDFRVRQTQIAPGFAACVLMSASCRFHKSGRAISKSGPRPRCNTSVGLPFRRIDGQRRIVNHHPRHDVRQKLLDTRLRAQETLQFKRRVDRPLRARISDLMRIRD